MLFFGIQRVLDILEGQKRQGWGFNGRRPHKAAAQTTEKKQNKQTENTAPNCVGALPLGHPFGLGPHPSNLGLAQLDGSTREARVGLRRWELFFFSKTRKPTKTKIVTYCSCNFDVSAQKFEHQCVEVRLRTSNFETKLQSSMLEVGTYLESLRGGVHGGGRASPKGVRKGFKNQREFGSKPPLESP